MDSKKIKRELIFYGVVLGLVFILSSILSCMVVYHIGPMGLAVFLFGLIVGNGFTIGFGKIEELMKTFNELKGN